MVSCLVEGMRRSQGPRNAIPGLGNWHQHLEDHPQNQHRKDIEERYTKGIMFTYVTEMIEVVKHALLKENVENALKVA